MQHMAKEKDRCIKSFECKVPPYLMLIPTLLIFGMFLFYPALSGVWTSLIEWDRVNPQKSASPQNYLEPAADQKSWEFSAHTILFTTWSVPLIHVSVLGPAVLLVGKIKGSNFFRVVSYRLAMIFSIVMGLT